MPTLANSDPTTLVLFYAALALCILLSFLLFKSKRTEAATRARIETQGRDLTKAIARLKELDRQKTEFVSIASHQLRSPLTAIKGYAALLLEGSNGKLSKGALAAVQKIFTASEYMSVSIEDFLNVSRIELGAVKYDMKDFKLSGLAQEIVDSLTPRATEKKLSLTLRTPKEPMSDTIHGDYGKLRQVGLNLVDNAIQYTPKGGITVEVEVDRVKRNARLLIMDTGVGIPPEIMSTLFGKFVRAKEASELNPAGTGLGLFVAKQFVEAHRGRIWAESRGQGKGSTFKVELPLSTS